MYDSEEEIMLLAVHFCSKRYNFYKRQRWLIDCRSLVIYISKNRGGTSCKAGQFIVIFNWHEGHQVMKLLGSKLKIHKNIKFSSQESNCIKGK
jgi:acyl-ACP thioesterase